jgi:hypothetical protein
MVVGTGEYYNVGAFRTKEVAEKKMQTIVNEAWNVMWDGYTSDRYIKPTDPKELVKRYMEIMDEEYEDGGCDGEWCDIVEVKISD